jgi:cyclophilin family peptidyl-prolyl cis-trans isomerase
MAKRRQKTEGMDELEAAIEETSEERRSKGGSSRTSSKGGQRRAARMARVEAERRARRNRLLTMAIVIVAVVVVASLGVWYLTRPEPQENPIVVFETSMGTFEVELYTDECPVTAGNFEKLTKDGFYNGQTFHRVIEDFMIQGGDPNGDGTGGPGYNIPAEDSALALEHDYGVISMANSGSPDTAGSQFFIVVNKDGQHSLDGSYAVFGKVVKGMDVVLEISKVAVRDNGQGEDSRPVTTIYMDKVYIKD